MISAAYSKLSGNKRYIITWLFLSACFMFVSVAQCTQSLSVTNSDISAELILSKLLSEEGALLTPNWYYSSEIRFFGLQWIFAPLFTITSDWQTVKCVGSIIWYALYLASVYYLCWSANIKNWFPIVGTLLILPYSSVYMYIILQGLFYIPHQILLFLILGSFLKILTGLKSGSPLKSFVPYLIIAGAASLLSGLNSMRLIAICNLPIVSYSIIRLHILRDKPSLRCLTFSIFITLCGVLGFEFNSIVLAKVFSYYHFEKITWTAFSFDGLQEFINYTIQNFGFISETGVFSFGALANIAAFIFMVLVLSCAIKKIKRFGADQASFLATVFLVSLIILLIICCFTSLAISAHYFAQTTSVGLIVLIISASHLKQSSSQLFGKLAATLLVCLVLLTCINFNTWYKDDRNVDLRQAVSFLQEKGYNKGYSYFWTSPVIEELSNGNIEMFTWAATTEDKIFSFQRRESWLQKKSHDTYAPKDDSTFVIIPKAEDQTMLIDKLVMDELEPLFENESYMVFTITNAD